MTDVAATGAAPGRPDEEPRWDQYRTELTGYCYRMLGSSADAEDAVQDALVRAWRSWASFEGRSSVRSWLYRIATNVCLTMLDGRKRRARPMDFGGPGTPEPSSLGAPLPEVTWLEPVPDARVLPAVSDPADVAVSRESIRLAFVAALQHLPPRQRVVLILREVLQWRAAEVAELLDTTVASVNSALQRARATLGDDDLDLDSPADDEMDDAHRELLARYADAFERYDIEAMVALLHDDAVLSMPPFALWLQGPTDIATWWDGPGAHCRGSRLVPLTANGTPAFAQYRRADGGGHAAWALQVVEVADGRVAHLNSFLDVEGLFPRFGLPLRIEEGAPLPEPATP